MHLTNHVLEYMIKISNFLFATNEKLVVAKV